MLTINDVERMIPPPPHQLDQTTKELIIEQRKVIFERRIKHVYENLTLFNKIWPNGQPIDLFIALMLSNDRKQLAFHKILNQNFLLQIIWQAETFGYHHFTSKEEKIEYIQTNANFIDDLTENELEIFDARNFISETSEYDSDEGNTNYSFNIEQYRKASLNRAHSSNKTDNFPKISESSNVIKPISNCQPTNLNSITINRKGMYYTAGVQPD